VERVGSGARHAKPLRVKILAKRAGGGAEMHAHFCGMQRGMVLERRFRFSRELNGVCLKW